MGKKEGSEEKWKKKKSPTLISHSFGVFLRLSIVVKKGERR
jgi:hypothetical protein